VPGALTACVEKTADKAGGVARNLTIEVARLASVTPPAGFMTALSSWVQEDPASRASVAQWASSCGRWEPQPSLKSSAAGDEGEAPGRLLPFIAGCDAYEWGLLGAFSKKNEAGAATAAAVLCQQAAEYLAAVPAPFEAARCIDAVYALLQSDKDVDDSVKAIFAARTHELVDGFVKRLRSHAGELRLVARTDLQRHFEEVAGSLSYKAGTWLGLAWRDPSFVARFDAIDAQLGEKLRQLDRRKLEEACAEGTELLENIGALAAEKLSAQQRNELLNRLIGSNDRSLDRDETDSADLTTQVVELGSKKWGLPLDLPVADNRPEFTYRSLFRNAIRQVSGIEFDVPRATAAPRRRALATLLLRRGLDPATPTALELYGRAPQPGRIPESIEQAITDPIATTLEALHKSLFGFPDAARTYLLYGRRTGAPCFLPAQDRRGSGFWGAPV
jgi:hypothetical protein